ncbi:hypothetical protein [Kangiella sp.]|uniref:hypothetical protein n=1 Tax=Kangiella sp. TaxID=1920245 RepID=UPI003A8FC2D7
MSGEVVEVTDYKSTAQDLTVSNQDVSAVSDHIATIRSFVQKELKEGINKDYATIPFTPKPSLLKPGAEKLLKLFGLSTRVELVSKEVDRYENYAEFTYMAKVYHIKTGQLIAECEAMANSWEKKYKTNKKGEVIPVADILNTLMKMAQKRAIVGATILATGASDYFTQDPDEIEAQGIRSEPVNKDRFKKSDSNLGEYVVPVGKFKDKKLSEIDKKDLINYCKYITENSDSIDGKLKEFIDTAREFIR